MLVQKMPIPGCGDSDSLGIYPHQLGCQMLALQDSATELASEIRTYCTVSMQWKKNFVAMKMSLDI